MNQFYKSYNKENKEIGKVWLCLEVCGMTESEPFSPNMKYGRLSEIGKEKLNFILNLLISWKKIKILLVFTI